jgi:hypothetical protein
MAESSSQQQNDADDGEICPAFLLAGAHPHVRCCDYAGRCHAASRGCNRSSHGSACGSQAERRSQASEACCL